MMRVKAAFLGLTRWRWAVVITDELANTIIVKKPWWAILRTLNIPFNPAHVTALEIHMQDPLFRDGLLPWLIGLMTGTKVPVVRLAQAQEGRSPQEVYLRSVQPGRAGYIFTRLMALDLADFLRRRNVTMALPDLVDDERWRLPVVATILTVVVPIALSVICVIIYVAIMISATAGQ
jgi:hypothetical protein